MTEQKDKTLSSKKHNAIVEELKYGYFLPKDVKDFIQKLKEELTGNMQPKVVTEWIKNTIDKLAGDDLIHSPQTPPFHRRGEKDKASKVSGKVASSRTRENNIADEDTPDDVSTTPVGSSSGTHGKKLKYKTYTDPKLEGSHNPACTNLYCENGHKQSFPEKTCPIVGCFSRHFTGSDKTDYPNPNHTYQADVLGKTRGRGVRSVPSGSHNQNCKNCGRKENQHFSIIRYCNEAEFEDFQGDMPVFEPCSDKEDGK